MIIWDNLFYSFNIDCITQMSDIACSWIIQQRKSVNAKSDTEKYNQEKVEELKRKKREWGRM